jgi:hypothetical protein
MPLGLAHETHKLSQPLKVGADSLVFSHLFSRIDHKILYGNKQTQINTIECVLSHSVNNVQNYHHLHVILPHTPRRFNS